MIEGSCNFMRELLIVHHFHAKFGGQRYCGSRDMFLDCRVIKGSYASSFPCFRVMKRVGLLITLFKEPILKMFRKKKAIVFFLLSPVSSNKLLIQASSPPSSTKAKQLPIPIPRCLNLKMLSAPCFSKSI